MSLTTVEEIESAIRTLSPRELNDLYSWLDQQHSQLFDARVKGDLAASHLDAAISRALDEERNGCVHPL